MQYQITAKVTDCKRLCDMHSLNDISLKLFFASRSNVLWLPVSAKVLTRLDWEPKLHNPSYSVGISTGSLTLFAGPETIVAFTQLSDKLSVYLQV